MNKRPFHIGSLFSAILSAALFLSLSLSGCSPDAVHISPSLDEPTRSSVPSCQAVRRVLIFGDSYTQGVGATPQNSGYAYQMGNRLGWLVTVDGVGGTGFVNPAGTQGTFLTRLYASSYGDDFDLILIEGGTNYLKYDPTVTADAIEGTLNGFSMRFPRARIVILGVFNWTGNVDRRRIELNEELSRSASRHTEPTNLPEQYH